VPDIDRTALEEAKDADVPTFLIRSCAHCMLSFLADVQPVIESGTMDFDFLSLWPSQASGREPTLTVMFGDSPLNGDHSGQMTKSQQ
jgi:hypothetical protein